MTFCLILDLIYTVNVGSMDGKRSKRVAGTDGSDHQYRQRVDVRYESLASAKDFINNGSLVVTGASLISFGCCLFDPKVYGGDMNVILSVIYAVALIANGFISKQRLLKPVDQTLIFHGVFFLIAAGVAVYSAFHALYYGREGPYPVVAYLLVAVHFFEALVSYRMWQAFKEIHQITFGKEGAGEKSKRK